MASKQKSSASVLKDFLAVKHLAAGLIAAGAATFLSDNRGGAEFLSRLLEVGAPTVVGCTIGDYVGEKVLDGDEEQTIQIADAAIGGVATVGLMMLPGWLPRELDGQVLLTGAIAAGACFLGHEVSKLVSK